MRSKSLENLASSNETTSNLDGVGLAKTRVALESSEMSASRADKRKLPLINAWMCIRYMFQSIKVHKLLFCEEDGVVQSRRGPQ